MNEKQTCELQIDGMHCAACEIMLEDKISKIKGVSKVNASLGGKKVELKLDKGMDYEELTKEINKLIQKEGYSVGGIKQKKSSPKEYLIAFLIASIFGGAFILLQKTGVQGIDFGATISYPVIFFIGILASLSTCMAVTGGLVLTMSSKYAKEERSLPITAFHISRIIGFFILGGLIGLAGATFKITPEVNLIIDVVLFISMILIGLNLLGIFPGLDRFQLHLPKFMGKQVIKSSESNNFFTPIILGLLTFFLPCGFTQSMQLYALNTGSFLTGALVMLVFALGTLPILGLISFASVKFSQTLQSSLFFKISGILIIFFAIFNLISSLVLIGVLSPIFNI